MKKEQPILSICIPTYNRAKDLNHNLTLIESYLENTSILDTVCFVISNNCSTDETDVVVKHFVDEGRLCIHYYKQEHNIGAGPNQVYAVEKASTPWVMLLGDDDYLEPWYIVECINQIDEHPKLGCIIPNYIDYNTITKEYGSLREENCNTEYYTAGFSSCLENTWRAHQLSGLCFRRANLVEEYHRNKMNNLYPQIFFVGYNSLRYDVLHFGERCLAVSGVPQSSKDWNYGNDGLMNDICENFKNLQVSYSQRAKLEANFNKMQKRYLWACKNMTECVNGILDSKNITILGKYYISHQILKDIHYIGRKYRLWFYLIARLILFKNLLKGRIGI